MKTAISIPDAEFEAAEKVAKRLGMSRSKLYRKAIADFLTRHADHRVTEKLNEVYAEDSGSQLDIALQWMQAKSISKEQW
jgi:RimJ/RimL family protein N-acetyltransferase